MAGAPQTQTDKRGRVLTVQELGPSDMLDLVEAAEDASMNRGWMLFAMRVCSVTAIQEPGGETVPVLRPSTKADVKALADRLGFDGLDAVDKALGAAAKDVGEAAKN